jgi:zinc/manganese transport system ATP-binding protein
MSGAIRLEGLAAGYGRDSVLTDIHGSFVLGSATAVIGPNGAGKSTLLKTIAGLLKPQAGRIALDGCQASQIAYLPQRTDLERSFPLSARDLVMLGNWREIGAFTAARRDANRACDDALARVGLTALRDHSVGSLSYGQLQRALFARLIVQDAAIILLDEPFAAMDVATTGDLLALIAEWQRAGKTLIAALHDLSQVRDYFPNALLIDRRVIAWGPAEEALALHTHTGADCGGHEHK